MKLLQRPSKVYYLRTFPHSLFSIVFLYLFLFYLPKTILWILCTEKVPGQLKASKKKKYHQRNLKLAQTAQSEDFLSNILFNLNFPFSSPSLIQDLTAFDFFGLLYSDFSKDFRTLLNEEGLKIVRLHNAAYCMGRSRHLFSKERHFRFDNFISIWIVCSPWCLPEQVHAVDKSNAM